MSRLFTPEEQAVIDKLLENQAKQIGNTDRLLTSAQNMVRTIENLFVVINKMEARIAALEQRDLLQ